MVDVTEEGFFWNGKTWRSLSVIAREITGHTGPGRGSSASRERPVMTRTTIRCAIYTRKSSDEG
ncbi:DUF2924 domain-containing protein [Maritimibacter sp.]|uniref:DUF2924 domain-containing protein n=1 Tax=Maritimibacter sp. TaxID=2003363 RepID=UPI00257B61CE|nr:DUF2924 domain-containing protein [Maritimibacter sp.]